MKIALFGGTGTIGQRILNEALARGHQVTVIVRSPEKVAPQPNLTAVKGDVFEPASIESAARGHDAVVSAFGPGVSGEPQQLVQAARALVEGAEKAGVRRLIIVNGAGSLEVAPGVKLIETPQFPDAWRPLGYAHADALAVLRACALDWTAISPAAFIEPGARTGTFRTGTDQLIVDANGNSTISMEDFAVGLLDELETPQNVRRRMTVGY